MDALFNVFKPRGPTSHDVVVRLRRASGIKRIGHAGTLDPLAQGVLVVATGQATRLLEYLAETDKAYRADVTFGVETDTYDAEGRVVAERSAAHLCSETVEAALGAFRGKIDQRPPAHSALSVGGKRLYELARRGAPLVPALRRVEISRLDLLRWAPPVATLDVECSKGTYVRSLAHDLGQALGCGAHLSGLVRLRIGPFLAESAIELAALETQLRSGQWAQVALPPDLAVAHLAMIHLDAPSADRVWHGRVVPLGEVPGSAPSAPGSLARAYTGQGSFIGLVRHDDDNGTPVWRPEKVFARNDASPPLWPWSQV